MTAAKHTPGPWLVSASGPTVYALHSEPRRNRFTAQVQRGRADDASYDELQANARLIAAAPDLLEVARLLALATDEGDDAAQGTHYVAKDGRIRCKGSFLETIEKARRAIAKATGSAA